VPDFFEGTEKRIEVDFVGTGDLRNVPQSGWEEVVQLSSTQILRRRDTEAFSSFLLSESSLIVYPSKVILKTCGRTVPLCCITRLLELANAVGLQPEWLCYSRKNFLREEHQPREHQSKEAEIAICRRACRDLGDAYVLGQLTGDHWLIYSTEFLWTDCSTRGDFQVDLMMYDLPKDICEVFHTNEPEGSAEGAAAMAKASGLESIAESIGGQIDGYCFSPCGYSCNIHTGGAYAMVHVTPQEHCSYASFETNLGSTFHGLPSGDVSDVLNTLVGRVLDALRPQKLTLTLFMDQGAETAIGTAPFAAAGARYRRQTHTSAHFEQDYSATIATYTSKKRKLNEVEEGR